MNGYYIPQIILIQDNINPYYILIIAKAHLVPIDFVSACILMAMSLLISGNCGTLVDTGYRRLP